MQKTVSIILLLIILLIVPTYIYVNKYQKKLIKKEIKQQIINGIDKDELALLVFHKNEVNHKVRWEHSKEFEYENTMYDIVETYTKKDSIYYRCWIDKKETKLNNRLALLLKNHSSNFPSNKQTKTLFSNFLKSLYFEAESHNNLVITDNSGYNSYYLNNYLSLLLQTEHLPPWTKI